MVEYITRQSWSEAFEAVIPQRKFETVGRKERRGKSNWKTSESDPANPGADDQGEDEQDEGMSDVDEAPFDWSRADGGDQAEEVDEEAAMNV